MIIQNSSRCAVVMWKPVLKILPWGVAAGVAWTAGCLYNNFSAGLIGRLHTMYSQKIALVSEIKAPKRLILVGGSGVLYSINSEVMQQELGFPVFNLGLDGNLGLNMIFPNVISQIRPGDIVLLIPEYLMLLDETGVGERAVAFGLGAGRIPENINPKRFAEDLWISGIPSMRSLVKTSMDLIQKGKIDDYYADPVTANGDPTKTFERKSKWWQMPVERPVTEHSIKRITQFRDEVEAKGAKLILSLPVIYGSTDEKTMANVKETAEKLSQIAPLIYDLQSLNIKTDSKMFADTHYHLQPEERVNRSKELVQELKPLLESKQSKK